MLDSEEPESLSDWLDSVIQDIPKPQTFEQKIASLQPREKIVGVVYIRTIYRLADDGVLYAPKAAEPYVLLEKGLTKTIRKAGNNDSLEGFNPFVFDRIVDIEPIHNQQGYMPIPDDNPFSLILQSVFRN